MKKKKISLLCKIINNWKSFWRDLDEWYANLTSDEQFWIWQASNKNNKLL